MCIINPACPLSNLYISLYKCIFHYTNALLKCIIIIITPTDRATNTPHPRIVATAGDTAKEKRAGSLLCIVYFIIQIHYQNALSFL